MLAFTALGAAALESCLCSWPLAGIKSSAKQSKAKQSKAKQIKAKQSKAMQSKAKQIHAKQSKAGLGGGSPATRGVWGAGVPPGSETQFFVWPKAWYVCNLYRCFCSLAMSATSQQPRSQCQRAMSVIKSMHYHLLIKRLVKIFGDPCTGRPRNIAVLCFPIVGGCPMGVEPKDSNAVKIDFLILCLGGWDRNS